MFGLVQGEANAIQPGKRMLSAMSPTIVLDRDGSLLLVVGSRGGPRIITSTSQVILNVLDQHMILADAMSAPRIHHQALPDSLMYERGGFGRAGARLAARDGLRHGADRRRRADQRDHARARRIRGHVRSAVERAAGRLLIRQLDMRHWRLAAIALSIAAVVAVVSTYFVFSQTSDEPAHIACGMEWLTRGTYTYDGAQHPPLTRVLAALGPFARGARTRRIVRRALRGRRAARAVAPSIALGSISRGWVSCRF